MNDGQSHRLAVLASIEDGATPYPDVVAAYKAATGVPGTLGEEAFWAVICALIEEKYVVLPPNPKDDGWVPRLTVKGHALLAELRAGQQG